MKRQNFANVNIQKAGLHFSVTFRSDGIFEIFLELKLYLVYQTYSANQTCDHRDVRKESRGTNVESINGLSGSPVQYGERNIHIS